MERKRKRNRSAPETDRTRMDSEEKSTARPAPSEEEVEEFFAILRRVHNAVKGSGKSSHGEGARAELQGELLSATALVDGGRSGKRSNGVIDLNTVPDDRGEFNGG